MHEVHGDVLYCKVVQNIVLFHLRKVRNLFNTVEEGIVMPLWLVFAYCFFSAVVVHGAFRWHTSKINEWSFVGILGECFKLLMWIFLIATPLSFITESAEGSLIGAFFCYFLWLYQTRKKSIRRMF